MLRRSLFFLAGTFTSSVYARLGNWVRSDGNARVGKALRQGALNRPEFF